MPSRAQELARVLWQARRDGFDVIGLDHELEDVEDGSGVALGSGERDAVQALGGDPVALGDAMQEGDVLKLLPDSGVLEPWPQRLGEPSGQLPSLVVLETLRDRLEHGAGGQLGLGARERGELAHEGDEAVVASERVVRESFSRVYRHVGPPAAGTAARLGRPWKE
jgi:hypothetical protein